MITVRRDGSGTLTRFDPFRPEMPPSRRAALALRITGGRGEDVAAVPDRAAQIDRHHLRGGADKGTVDKVIGM